MNNRTRFLVSRLQRNARHAADCPQIIPDAGGGMRSLRFYINILGNLRQPGFELCQRNRILRINRIAHIGHPPQHMPGLITDRNHGSTSLGTGVLGRFAGHALFRCHRAGTDGHITGLGLGIGSQRQRVFPFGNGRKTDSRTAMSQRLRLISDSRTVIGGNRFTADSGRLYQSDFF